jgi:outer membrane biosynthesis protein TonB
MAYALHPVAISAFCLVSFLFPMGCRAQAGTPASGERKWGFQAQSDALRSPAEQSPGGGGANSSQTELQERAGARGNECFRQLSIGPLTVGRVSSDAPVDQPSVPRDPFPQSFVSAQVSKNTEASNTNSNAPLKVGGDVSAPRVIYQPDPEYSERARKAGHQGSCVLRLIVGTDGKAL